jgi:hypothetical protein
MWPFLDLHALDLGRPGNKSNIIASRIDFGDRIRLILPNKSMEKLPGQKIDPGAPHTKQVLKFSKIRAIRSTDPLYLNSSFLVAYAF